MFIVDDIVIGLSAIGSAFAGAASTAGGMAVGAATTAGGMAVGAATTAGGMAVGAASAAGGMAVGAATTVGGMAVGAASTVGGMVVGTTTTIGTALATAGTAAAGTVVTVGGSAIGTATAAGGVVLSAGGTAAGTIIGAAESALAAAAEMAAAAAAESTVLVGQIPVIGEPLAAGIQTVGSTVGEVATHAAKSVGLSTKSAKAIGTIASSTTTNEINNQVLKPYNEIKYQVTGLSEIRDNVKILDDIAHGRISADDLKDIAYKYQDELTSEVLKELDVDEIKEIKDNLQYFEDIRAGKYTYEEIANHFADYVDDEDFQTARKQLNAIKSIRACDLNGDEIVEVLLDEMDLPDSDELRTLQKLYSGNATKEELQQILLEELDAPDVSELTKDVETLKRIARGDISKGELENFVLERINDERFSDIKDNWELYNALRNGELNKQGLSALVAEKMGVKGLLGKVQSAPMPKRSYDCLLHAWTSIPQDSNFYDIFIEAQYIPNECVEEVRFFFPSILVEEVNDRGVRRYFLSKFSIQNIGDPVVSSVVSFLIRNAVSFKISESWRAITIDSLGDNSLELLELYSDIIGIDADTGCEDLSNLPCTFPNGFSVKTTAQILKILDAMNVQYRVNNVTVEPRGLFDFYVYHGGKNELELVKLFKDYDVMSSSDAIEFLKAAREEKQLLFSGIEFTDAIGWLVAMQSKGAVCGICSEDGDLSLYESFLYQ